MPLSMTKEQKIKAMEFWPIPDSVTCACDHVLTFLVAKLTGSKVKVRKRVGYQTKVVLGEAKRPGADVYDGSLMCWRCISRIKKYRAKNTP
jgi:hypothetical protein